MAWIHKVNRKKKGIGCQVVIRRAGIIRKKTFNRKLDAERWAADLEEILDMKINQDPRLAMKVTLGEAFDKYFQMMEVVEHLLQQTEHQRAKRVRQEKPRGKAGIWNTVIRNYPG